VIGGNTDIGFLFGAYGALARFEPGYWPYRWKMEAVISLTVKEGPDGAELPVHNHGVAIDVPGLLGGRVRILSDLAFARDIDARYFGVGNASSSLRGPRDGRRRYQYVRSEPTARLMSRIKLWRGFDLLAGVRGRYELIEPYSGSKLAEDAGAGGSKPVVHGASNHAIVLGYVGLLLDTRDHETTPSRGMLHELSFRASGGEGVAYGGATFNARFFVPLLGPRLVLGARLMADVMFGAPPFYELSRAGGFVILDSPGGKYGIRGVPSGRYHGPFKMIAGAELRAMLVSFGLFGQRFRLGAAAFGEAGRSWSTPELDGPALGLKFGVGGGPRIHWGETVVVRADFAYSPDAEVSPGDTPLGIYVEIGQSF
jgi:hypothetical protein